MLAPGPSIGPQGEVTCVAGRTFCLSGGSGQIRPGGDQGVYLEDTRVLSTLLLTLDGAEPLALGGYPLGPGAARFSACARHGDETDPTLIVERHRRVTDTWHEDIRITNHGVEPVEVVVEVDAAADFAYIFDVKHGRPPPSFPGRLVDDGLLFSAREGASSVLVCVAPPPDRELAGRLQWTVKLPSQSAWQVELHFPTDTDIAAAHGPAIGRQRPAGVGSLASPRISCSDRRFERLIERSVVDLDSLLVRDDGDRYFAAGTPWFLTLFGRDSLWSARMSLPLGVEVPGETLRLLARMQGQRHDPVTEEGPGKILHEVRYGPQVDRGDLPPRYFGSIDATPLFVVGLERAWRWGLDPDAVEALLPNAERALAWIRDNGDPDGSGFLRYAASGDRRLANQGWKDSGDAISFADGRLADAPIALCEVQGYAYQAATAGAAMLDAFDRPGGDDWRAWAETLRTRFHDAFWDADDPESFPALALDGEGRRVDSITSNAAHLLGTGLLDPAQQRRVAARLGRPDLDSGWGLRTLSADSPRFNPLSYHGGSVWPHDTAIAIDGLARAGAGSVAAKLLQGLLAAGEHLGYRLPELFGGEQRTPGSHPFPYPTACRPQAWAAGAGLLALRAVLGIEPDVPGGVVHLRPMYPAPFVRLTVDGIPLAGGRLSLHLENDQLVVTEAPADLDVIVSPHDAHAHA